MRWALVGAVESTHAALETLSEVGHGPVALVTLPRSRANRHSDWVDLDAVAECYAVPVLKTADVNEPSLLDQLGKLDLDYSFVIGWSQICKPAFLALPRGGAIGFHPAPLPLNRGRAVIPWTILQGREDTGSTLFWMDQGMDTGDILAQHRFAVAPDETARSLYDKHLLALRQMLIDSLVMLEAGAGSRRPQDHAAATYCARRTAEDGCIDWRAPATAVWTLVRATGDPYPGAFSFTKTARVTVWEAEYIGPAPFWGLPGQVQSITPDGAVVQCGDREHVLLRTVQLDDGERQPADTVLRVHDRFTTEDRRRTP